MESSIVFSAAAKTNKKAMAFLYVTDVVGKTNFYETPPKEDQKRIGSGRRVLAYFLYDFIKDHLSK